MSIVKTFYENKFSNFEYMRPVVLSRNIRYFICTLINIKISRNYTTKIQINLNMTITLHEQSVKLGLCKPNA